MSVGRSSLRVRVATAATGPTAARPDPAAGGPDLSGGWRATTWIGAPAPGGLALPPAAPTRAWCYSPRGVHVDADQLVVADSGNHRVLIWHGVPGQDGRPADVVLGQPDDTTEGRAAGGRGPERGFNLPTGVLVHEGRLVVADAWHHRILVWDSVPRHDDVAPDLVVGQPDASSVEPNAGRTCDAGTFYWPFGVAVVDGRFLVADTGNRRVLGWDDGIPDDGRPADLVLGQPDAASREENRGGEAAADSFRWPHDLAGTADVLLVADAGNHRVLGWQDPPRHDRPAELVIGQPDMSSSAEWPYGPHSGDRFRFPYALALDAGRLFVADTAQNRVLAWDGDWAGGRAADHVLAQPSFTTNGENRWSAVEHDTLCWPYGLSVHGDVLAVADSGNNRVVLWRRG
ncbi:MAG: hypothetical protein ABS81_12010 [Pseudonocardia sp. SCN 72-86]|nr:MAG: hypothetical protein ABS81_12010 [Pseudonocardia sp. SCN 72-86]